MCEFQRGIRLDLFLGLLVLASVNFCTKLFRILKIYIDFFFFLKFLTENSWNPEKGAECVIDWTQVLQKWSGHIPGSFDGFIVKWRELFLVRLCGCFLQRKAISLTAPCEAMGFAVEEFSFRIPAHFAFTIYKISYFRQNPKVHFSHHITMAITECTETS